MAGTSRWGQLPGRRWELPRGEQHRQRPTTGNRNTTGNGNGTNRTTTATTAATATGTVSEVSKIATATSGVASYTVTVAFDGDPTKVFIGSTVSATITTSSHEGVLIPSLAVTTEGTTSTVLVATDGTAEGATERRTVVTGSTVGNQIEITSGLQAGEQVLIEVTVPTGRTGTGEGGRTGEGGFPGRRPIPRRRRTPGERPGPRWRAVPRRRTGSHR